jgi:hypothetical protein
MSGPGLKLRLEDGRPGRFWVDDALIDAKLRSHSKLVYCTLARMVRGITIKISHSDLARLTDLSVSSVKRGLVELHKTRWIEIVASGGLKQENTYRLLGQPDRTIGQPELALIGQPELSDRSARATTTEEATSEEAVEAKQEEKQHRAPHGAAEPVQATQGGLLFEDAVVVEAVLEASPVPPPRPAGPTRVAAAAPGVSEPAHPGFAARLSHAAAAPARRGHPAIAPYYDRWRATHGKTPAITPKKVGILTRIYKGLGPEAPDEYPRLLDALFRSDDRFILENAHSPEVFETKLDTLRVNDNGHGKTQGTNKKWAGRTVREIGR